MASDPSYQGAGSLPSLLRPQLGGGDRALHVPQPGAARVPEHLEQRLRLHGGPLRRRQRPVADRGGGASSVRWPVHLHERGLVPPVEQPGPGV